MDVQFSHNNPVIDPCVGDKRKKATDMKLPPYWAGPRHTLSINQKSAHLWQSIPQRRHQAYRQISATQRLFRYAATLDDDLERPITTNVTEWWIRCWYQVSQIELLIGQVKLK